jgi:formylglycine-generating enzyme required for sulfatase activity
VTRLLAIGIFVLAAGRSDGSNARADRTGRVLIPAGPFTRGSTRGADDERPVKVTTLPAFHIDRTEVTRAMYGRCVAALRCKALAVDFEAEPNLPVTNVNWSEARAFCAFAGGRLPTEDEWEKAARGGDGREYPWGKNPGKPVDVGSYPQGASPFGVLDMAGNVWEWVADKYDRDPSRRVVRGGSCCSYFVEPRSANRNAWDPNHRDGDLGFRCVSR